SDLRVWNAAKSIPILYVTHSREEVEALAERVLAMDCGKIVGEGDSQQILDAPRKRSLAVATGFENLLTGKVVEVLHADGVMHVRLAHVNLEVPLAEAQPGDAVQIAIRAGDILLATEKPHGISARNVLQGTIVSMEDRGALVLVCVDCSGDKFHVQVTRVAVRMLDLTQAKLAWVAIK